MPPISLLVVQSDINPCHLTCRCAAAATRCTCLRRSSARVQTTLLCASLRRSATKLRALRRRRATAFCNRFAAPRLAAPLRRSRPTPPTLHQQPTSSFCQASHPKQQRVVCVPPLRYYSPPNTISAGICASRSGQRACAAPQAGRMARRTAWSRWL